MITVVAVLAITLVSCSNKPAEPAPANASPAHTPIDATAIPAQIRVLDSHGLQTNRIATALEQWINDGIAPQKTSVTVIPTAEDALIADLLAGKGDIAANLLVTFERDDQVAFAKPLLTDVRQLVVTGPNEPRMVSLEDVGGRAIHVRKTSDHYASLIRLNAQLKEINRPPARIVLAAPSATDEDLLALVNAGKIPATLADDYVYDACCSALAGLKTNRDVAVSQGGILAWATRKDAPKLLAVLDQFFSTHSFTPRVP